MCGIAGVVNAEQIELEPGTLRRMADVIRHRGPDEQGFFRERRAALTAVRLAIQDIEGGHQPMANEDGSVHIVYNGECYNFLELADELRARGHILRTSCDTEVVLHLFEDEGPECVSRLNGQFAFAVWDSRAGALFLARDRMGIKPLCYAEVDGFLVFGSEAKAIFASGLVRAEPDLGAIDAVTAYGCIPSPRTAFRGVKSLPAGHTLSWQAGRKKVTKYWDVEYPRLGESDRRSEAYYAGRLREELTRATELRLISDAPLGAYLSGGLDSSCVIDRMAELHDGPLTTFSITFADRDFDESPYVRLMTEHVETENEAVECTDADIARSFPRLIWQAEVPLISTESAPLMLLSGLARRKVKVVLTGEGSDELFGGYAFDRFEKLRLCLARFPARMLSPFAKAFFRRRAGPYYRCFFPTAERRAATGRHFGVYPARSMEYGFFDLVRGMTYTEEQLERAAGADGPAPLPFDTSKLRDLHPFDASLYLSQKLFLEAHLLAAHGDRAAMANSVESRFPFLDHNVVEFCAGVPPELKMKRFTEKHILRAAFRERLPHRTLRRRKQPFLAPFGTPFLGEGMSEEAKDLLSEESIREKGYFGPAKVWALRSRLEGARGANLTGRRRQSVGLSRELIERTLLGMALTFVFSVQLWDEIFLRGTAWPRRAPSTVDDPPVPAEGER